MSGREKFVSPREYPAHWAFWTGIVAVVLALLVVSPTVGLAAATIVLAIGVARWFGVIQ